MFGTPGCQIRKLSLYRLLYFPFPLPHIGHTVNGKAECLSSVTSVMLTRRALHQSREEARGETAEI
jgi:hypothetical protein